MSDLKTSSFRKTFGSSDLNLWDTVDAIMMDLVGNTPKSLRESAEEDNDLIEEPRRKNIEKDKELDVLMQNLDSLIDDLNDLGDIMGDDPPPARVRPVYPERTVSELKISEEDQFLQKENPFDPITQGLREVDDVALFSNIGSEELLPQIPHHLPDIHRMGIVPDKYPTSPDQPSQDSSRLTPTLPSVNGKTSPRMVARSSRMIGYSRRRSNSNPDLFSTSPDSPFSQSPSPSPSSTSKSIFFPSPPQSSPSSLNSPISVNTALSLGQHRVSAANKPPLSSSPVVGSPLTNGSAILSSSGSRLIFGKDSGEIPQPASSKSTFSIGSRGVGASSLQIQRAEVKDRNSKIKQLRDLLRRYRGKLVQFLSKHHREIVDIQGLNNTTRAETTRMLQQTFIPWGQQALIRSYRNVRQAKVRILEIRREIREAQQTLLRGKIVEIDNLIELLDAEYQNNSQRKDFVIYSSFFQEPQELMASREVKFKMHALSVARSQKKTSKLDFKAERQACAQEPVDKRTKRLKDVLGSVQPVYGVADYYEASDDVQRVFDSFVVDQRYIEGRQIAHLRTVLQEDIAGNKTIQPVDIIDFIEQFARKMAETYSLPVSDASGDSMSTELSKLSLLCKRAIYPRIYQYITQLIPPDTEAMDSKFLERVGVLHNLSLAELSTLGLDLDKRIFSSNKIKSSSSSSSHPFEDAVNILEDIGLLLVPTDMVMAIHTALKITHDTAVKILKTATQPGNRSSVNMAGANISIRNSISYGGAEAGGMGMDDVFPLFLWVVIHSGIANVGKCLYIMENYCTQQERMSALGWCTTSLAAAVAHISQMGSTPVHDDDA